MNTQERKRTRKGATKKLKSIDLSISKIVQISFLLISNMYVLLRSSMEKHPLSPLFLISPPVPGAAATGRWAAGPTPHHPDPPPLQKEKPN